MLKNSIDIKVWSLNLFDTFNIYFVDRDMGKT